MYYIERLKSLKVLTGILPWEFKPATPIPKEVRADKAKRYEWITNPSTKHHVYSFYEGLNSNLRITKNHDDEGNPPVKLWGLVADYDAGQPEEFVMKIAQGLPVRPNWIEKTLSGNWRYVWQFEEAAPLPSYDFACHFLKKFGTFGFPVEHGMVGLDKGAWLDPSRLFTNSCDWRKLNPSPIPKDIVRGWLVQASKTFEWVASEFGPAIPLEVVKAELEKKYPRFCEWPGEFDLNSQGPTFWIADSASPKSAIVRETGIQTFADHAHKSFFNWSDLLGFQFVKEYVTAAIGRAVEGIYFDGKDYFRQIANKRWKPWNKQDLANHLKVDRKVSPKNDRNGVSEIDRCIAFVHSHQTLGGCAPFAMRPAGLIEMNNNQYLNTSTRTAMTPAIGPGVWGETGKFPWASKLLDAFFEPFEQRDYFLSWLSRFYRAARNQKPRGGQNIFIAGPPGVGKTLLGTKIVASLVGGCAEANDYLLGDDKFGSDLFEVPLWSVDDAAFTADARTHRHFSEMIKKMAANHNFRYHAKFRIPMMVEWQGRVIVTCNTDPQSLRLLPEIERNILDKIMIFKTAGKTVDFPEPDELEAILQRELPFFAQFLLDYKIPQHLKGDSRFGVKSYHEPSLVQTARQSGHAARFLEILDDCMDQYFNTRKPEDKFWEGTAYQLQKLILLDEQAKEAMRRFGVDAIGHALVELSSKVTWIKFRDEDGKRIWTIGRPKAKPDGGANSNGAKVEGEAKLELSGVNLIPGATPGSFTTVPVGQGNKFQKVHTESAGDRAHETNQTSTSHASCASSQ